jgi:acyl-CoA thioesterase FadM
MNLLLRMLRVLICARWRPRTSPLDETSVTFHVWPTDLDPLFHMNNGRYLTLMDLGRADAILRNGIRRALSEHGWYPVVASEAIRFRESLNPFARYELRTRLLGWDERSFYYRQTFVAGERETAAALVRIRILRKGSGTVDAPEVAAVILPDVERPALPDYVARWQESERAYSRVG